MTTDRRCLAAFLEFSMVLCSCAAAPLAAQPAAGGPPRARRVGVALAGGSAFGLAHIGVLRWFTEHHIPVDVVAGTSMGGLVGGMYAAGYEPEEIHTFVAAIDWVRLFGPSPLYSQLIVRRKEDRLAFPNDLELGLRRGLTAPPGLNSGIEASLLFDRFAAPYGEMASFDDLPTPFRCVATDLMSGQPVVFDRGAFGQALRATMSIPGIFVPVRSGKQLLVDGGLVDNLPVDVVKSMSVDVTVAVSLETPPPDEAALDTFVGVSAQSLSLMISDNERRNLRLADLVISPDLAGLDKTDFDRQGEFEERGYKAAEERARFLLPLALLDADWERYLAERSARRRILDSPSFVDVTGAGRDTPRAGRILSRLVGEPPDPAAIESRIGRVVGDSHYAGATYREILRSGQPGYEVALSEKRYAPPFVDLGIVIDGSKVTDMKFEMSGRVTLQNVGATGSEWRNDVSLGIRNLLASEYYLPVGLGSWFIAPRGFTENTRRDFYQGDVVAAEYSYRRQGAGFDAGFAPGHNDEFRLGYEFTNLSTAVNTGLPPLTGVQGNLHYLRGRWLHDSTDSAAVPTAGLRITVESGWQFNRPGFGGSYPQFESQILTAHSFRCGDVVLLSLAGGSTFAHTTPYTVFFLGGPFQLSALGRDQLTGDSYYNTTFSYLHRLSLSPVGFFRRSYLDFGLESGKAFTDIAQANPFYDARLGILGVSRLGVITVGGSLGDAGKRKVYFRLGRVF